MRLRSDLREQRKREATERQAKRDARSSDQQLGLIQERPGNSEREKRRILNTLRKERDNVE